MDAQDYRKAAAFFKALSHPTRVAIVSELLKGEKCVSDIRELVKARQPNISQHLSLLKLSGIVEWRQEGKKKCYSLKEPQLLRDLFKILGERRLTSHGKQHRGHADR